MNLKGKIKKLQSAIIKNGLIIKINQVQFYSEDQKRMITSYRILTPVSYFSEKKSCWKNMDYEILKTCSVVELIYCLRDIYEAVRD